MTDLLLGVAVADACGVPHEFVSRQELNCNPVTGMDGHGSHNVPPGTWSDDTSLTLCLAYALCYPFSLDRVAKNFIAWLLENHWTATGHVFDVGNTTSESIHRLVKGVKPELSGGFYPDENGNGSLMRISVLVFFVQDKPIDERFEITRQVSSITHGHIRSIIACFYFLEFARLLLTRKDKFAVYYELKMLVSGFLHKKGINADEIALFNRLLRDDIFLLGEDDIQSTGYVLHTLEAAIWCLLTTENYRDAVLKAVNLGSDTDTTAAVCGGLAGLAYGASSIPDSWLQVLARRDDLINLSIKLNDMFKLGT